jgi:hypothetical protein
MKHLSVNASRTTSIRKLCIVPSVFPDVIDHGVRAFRRRAAWVAPPDLTVAGNLVGKDLVGLLCVQPVKEIVDVQLIGNLTNNTIVQQESVDPAPVIDFTSN